MFEAYTVAVRLSLISGVTAGLIAISQQFARTHRSAVALQSQLNKIKLTMLAGGALLGAGAFGFLLIDKAVKPATEYAAQLNRMRMAGMSNLEIAQATAAAWQNSSRIVTTTATDNLRSILDLKNVLGSMKDAMWALPIVSKIGAVMGSAAENSGFGTGQDVAFTMAKALDIIGAARDPTTFAREASMMSKVITAFQNRVNPRQYQSVFAYARQAKFDLSDEFKYEFLPSMMLEYAGGTSSAGGGSRGVGPMLAAIYRVTNQGYINRKAVGLWEKLGLVRRGSALGTTTEGTVTDPLKDRALAANNPFLFATQVLEPAIRRVFGPKITAGREREIIGELFRGNQLAAAAMMEFISKPQNYLRDQAIIRKAMPYTAAYDQAIRNDPNTAYAGLMAQWHNALIALGITVIPALIKGTILLTKILTALGQWMITHQTAVKILTVAFIALSGAMAIGGTVLLIASAFAGLALIMSGGAIAIAIGGVTAALAGLAYVASQWNDKKSTWQNIGDILLSVGKGLWNLWDGLNTFIGNILASPFRALWNGLVQGTAAQAAQNPYPWGGSAGASPFVPRPAGHGKAVGHVFLDGHKVGHIITSHQAKAAGAPPSGTTWFDSSMHLAPVGATW